MPGQEAKGGLTPGTKSGLAGLVSYQDGSIVSRAIVSGKAGTLTLFAFDSGESLSEHVSPYQAFLHVIEGEAEVTVAGKKSSVKSGEGIILPAGKPHAVKAQIRFKMLLTMIRE